MEDVKKALDSLAGKHCLFITIGNELRGDDGVGPYIGGLLAGIAGEFSLINGGQRPENVIDEAIEAGPEHTFIIDAANFGGQPGECRLLEPQLINQSTLSTHTFPLPVLASIIKEDTGSEIYFLGIQSSTMQLGEGLSPPVKTTAHKLVELIGELLEG